MTAISSPSTPKEKLTAYERWELASFDAPLQGSPVEILPSADQLKRLNQQAHEEGYAAGHREGSDKAAADAQRLQQIVTALTEESQVFEQHVADELLGLALAISKQILKQALKVRPELILSIIDEVLSQVSHAHQRMHLVMHPEDAVLVRARLGEQLIRSGCEILEDANMQRGGCRLHTPDCDIDATLERRWQRVVAAIGKDHDWIE